jgi:hypothetical protein
MGAMSDYLENKIIDHVFQGTPYTGPSTLYVALGTAASDSSFTELGATGGYARVAVTADASHWSDATGNNGTTANVLAITFPTATADWNGGSTIGYWAIYDAASNGNMLFYAAVTTPRAIVNGATASFAAGALTVQIDN